MTNNAALTLLWTKANLEGKMLRYNKHLLLYQYEIVFCPGRQNWLTNMLSCAVWVKEVSKAN